MYSSPYTNIAFISYKREDEKWAKWLQNKLEHYQLPIEIRKQKVEFAERPRHVFKDTTDLSGGVLEKAIKEGLASSKFLIVICSPRAAKSPWVCKEVQEFIDSGREEYIIPFIIDGEPYSKDIDNECFPEALKALAGKRELLGININENGRDSAAIKVVARLFGIRFDILWQRHKRAERLRRIIAGSVIVFVVLLMLSLLYSVVVYRSNKKQIQILNFVNAISEVEMLIEQDKAISASHMLLAIINENRNFSNEEKKLLDVAMVDCAEKLVNSKCELMSLNKLSRDATPIDNIKPSCNFNLKIDEEYLYLINSTINDSVYLGCTPDYPYPSHGWVSPDGTHLFLPPTTDCLEDAEVYMYNLSNGKLEKKIAVEGSWYRESNIFSVRNDNKKFLYYYCFRGENGVKEYGVDGECRNIITCYEGSEVFDARYSPSGNYILLYEIHDEKPLISIIDAKTYNIIYTFNDVEKLNIEGVYWGDDKRTDLLCIEDSLSEKEILEYIWKINKDGKLITQNKTLKSYCISNNGSLLAYATNEDSLYIYNTNLSHIVYQEKRDAYSMNFSNNGEYICFVDQGGGTADIFDIKNKEIKKSLPIDLAYNYNCHTGIVFSRNDESVVFTIGAAWGGISVWDIKKDSKIFTDIYGDSILFAKDYSKMIVYNENKSEVYEYDFQKRKKILRQDTKNTFYYVYEDECDKKNSNNKSFFISNTNENVLKYGKNVNSNLFTSLFRELINN